MVFFLCRHSSGLRNVQVKGHLPGVQKVQQSFLRIPNILQGYPFSHNAFSVILSEKGYEISFSLILHWEKSLLTEIHFQADTQAEGCLSPTQAMHKKSQLIFSFSYPQKLHNNLPCILCLQDTQFWKQKKNQIHLAWNIFRQSGYSVHLSTSLFL